MVENKNIQRGYAVEINGKGYKLKDLTLGQYQQLMSIRVDVDLPKPKTEEARNRNVLLTLNHLIESEKLPLVLAIILVPVEGDLWDKSIYDLSQEISFSITPELANEILSNFFALCPKERILEGMKTTTQATIEMIALI